MKRRDFGKAIAAGTAGAAFATTPSVQAQKKKKALMHVGCQWGSTSKENLEYKARHGVYHIDGGSPKTIKGVGWDIDDSLAIKEACYKYGISLEAYHLPISAGESGGSIMLGKSPDRDRDIAMLQQMIEVAGKTGVRLLMYNTVIFSWHRSGYSNPDPTRGNASYNTWDYQEALKKNLPKSIAGDVSIDQMYDRITYMLDRLIPVAEEWKVQLGNHIADPPTHAGYRGETRWNSPDVFEGIKRFAGLYKSPYHGFNLCIGSVAEGLKDPKTGIHPIIKYVGERKQIFNVHFRNIKGGWDKFLEVYPDNGDMDFYEVAKTFRDVEYPYMLMPDHAPQHDDPASGRQAFSFAYGYIKALIQAVNGEVV